MDEAKALNALGLARRAGKCVVGDYAVEKAVKSKKVFLVVIDEAASSSTKQRYRSLCERVGIAYMQMDGMGKAVGKPDSRIAAVADKGFVQMIARNKTPDFGGIYGQD